MRVKYMPVLGKIDVIPTSTTEKGRNTDRDTIGKAIEMVLPLTTSLEAPCYAEAMQLVKAGKAIIDWIETGKMPAKAAAPAMPPAKPAA